MRIAMAINTMKGHKIWLYSSELFGSDVNMFDGVAVLRCVELKWLVAGEAFQATSALVVPIRYNKSIPMFTEITSMVRKQNRSQLGRMTRSF